MTTVKEMTKLKWENFEKQFHESWHPYVKPLIESDVFAQDFAKLRELSKKSKTLPSSSSGNLFRCFRETPFDKMVAVVVGLSPYNTTVGETEVADGIALSCSNTMKEQPSLTQWYNAMEREFGNGIVRNPDLTYLAQRGVLMYNYSLTCGYRDATSHIPVWQWFSQELFRTAISQAEVPIITLGKEAEKISEFTMPWQKVINLKHPASASYTKTDWDSAGAFRDVQIYLAAKGIDLQWIDFKDKF